MEGAQDVASWVGVKAYPIPAVGNQQSIRSNQLSSRAVLSDTNMERTSGAFQSLNATLSTDCRSGVEHGRWASTYVRFLLSFEIA